jgi:hypothetical protein
MSLCRCNSYELHDSITSYDSLSTHMSFVNPYVTCDTLAVSLVQQENYCEYMCVCATMFVRMMLLYTTLPLRHMSLLNV